jgi:hypothetical protein
MARAIPTTVLPLSGRCCVCGCGEVHTDEVMDVEPLFLAECPRCDHRWTSRAPLPRVRKVAPRAALTQEALTAA